VVKWLNVNASHRVLPAYLAGKDSLPGCNKIGWIHIAPALAGETLGHR